jgi:hypothetical protein
MARPLPRRVAALPGGAGMVKRTAYSGFFI